VVKRDSRDQNRFDMKMFHAVSAEDLGLDSQMGPVGDFKCDSGSVPCETGSERNPKQKRI